MSTRWASGSPRSRLRAPAPGSVPPADRSADRSAEPSADRSAEPSAGRSAERSADRSAELGAEHAPRAGLAARAEQASTISAEWAPTVGRILLGAVFFWFGYHELVQPGHWTQYVPAVNESSSLAVILVLVHGWVLFVTAAALVAGIAPRAAAAIASVLLLEIVISLGVSGVSDTVPRDVGVLGLAICLTGCKNQRLVLRG